MAVRFPANNNKSATSPQTPIPEGTEKVPFPLHGKDSDPSRPFGIFSNPQEGKESQGKGFVCPRCTAPALQRTQMSDSVCSWGWESTNPAQLATWVKSSSSLKWYHSNVSWQRSSAAAGQQAQSSLATFHRPLKKPLKSCNSFGIRLDILSQVTRASHILQNAAFTTRARLTIRI